MDDVAQTVQPVVYSGLQNYQCFYQFKIINSQKLSIFISILYQLKLSILKIINYLLSILYQFLYQSSSKIINISKLSIENYQFIINISICINSKLSIFIIKFRFYQ